ncbi:MAG: hypothetical protein ACOVNS_03685 [Erythrobacter sp.]
MSQLVLPRLGERRGENHVESADQRNTDVSVGRNGPNPASQGLAEFGIKRGLIPNKDRLGHLSLDGLDLIGDGLRREADHGFGQEQSSDGNRFHFLIS